MCVGDETVVEFCVDIVGSNLVNLIIIKPKKKKWLVIVLIFFHVHYIPFLSSVPLNVIQPVLNDAWFVNKLQA